MMAGFRTCLRMPVDAYNEAYDDTRDRVQRTVVGGYNEEHDYNLPVSEKTATGTTAWAAAEKDTFAEILSPLEGPCPFASLSDHQGRFRSFTFLDHGSRWRRPDAGLEALRRACKTTARYFQPTQHRSNAQCGSTGTVTATRPADASPFHVHRAASNTRAAVVARLVALRPEQCARGVVYSLTTHDDPQYGANGVVKAKSASTAATWRDAWVSARA